MLRNIEYIMAWMIIQIYGPSQQKDTKEKHCPIIFKGKKKVNASLSLHISPLKCLIFFNNTKMPVAWYSCQPYSVFLPPSPKITAEFVHFNTAASHTSWVSKELCFIDHNDPAYLESTFCKTEIRKNTIMTYFHSTGQ